jgi:Flp pilus assembly protein TadG
MKKQHFPTSERGQSLVELAISLGVILMLLAGAINFGMALFSYVAIRDAAQEGAMYASLYPCLSSGTACDLDNEAAIREHVRSASTHPVDLASFADDQILIEFTGGMCEGTTSGQVNGVKVTVKYDQPIVMPFAGIFFGGQVIPLSASVTDTILTPSCAP